MLNKIKTHSILIGLLITNLISINTPSKAIETKFAPHTSKCDIDLKKKKAFEWNADNVDREKFYYLDGNVATKEIGSLKEKSLKWYLNNITKDKFYYIHGDHELAYLKKKSLRWYERNSTPKNKKCRYEST